MNITMKSFILISILFFLGCKNQSKQLIVKNGIIDFNNYNFEITGNSYLNGEWEFYWDTLFVPNELNTFKKNQSLNYVKIPDNWTHYTLDNKKLPENGKATYRIILNNLEDNKYALLVNQLASFNLYINGQLSYKGINSDPSKMLVSTPLVNLFSASPEDGSIEVVVQIQNKMFFKNAGLSCPVEFGLEKNMIFKKSLHLIIRAFLFGIILMAAFYNLSFFLFRKKDLSFLYFSLLCIFVALHTALMNEQLFRYFFINTSANAYYKILYTISFLLVPTYISFLYSLYRNHINPYIKNLFVFSSIALAISAIVLNAKFLLPFISPLLFYEVIVLLAISYVIYTYIKIVKLKKEGIFLELIGVTSFFSSVIIYIIFERQNVDASFIMPFGLTVYIIFQTFLLSDNYSRSIEEKNRYLIKIDKLKDDFLAKTTHELRTPLNGIIGIAESLLNGVAGPVNDKIKSNLSLITSSGKRLTNIINDILDFSKLKNKDLSLNKKTVDINVIADVVVSVMKKVAQDKNIEIINITPANIPFVWGDENRLLQIMYNLIGNAIKFTNKGLITINAQRQNEYIEISISDTGIGIDKNKQAHIFDSFEQTYSADEINEPGCGLGLSITKNLVELHNGLIRVESEINKGAQFFFTIPISKTGIIENSDTPPLSNILEDPDFNKSDFIKTDIISDNDITIETNESINVLAVDDEPINLQVITNYLSLENFSIHTAHNGEKALEILNSIKIDIVLLDIMMPRISGYEVCEKIRDNYSQSELPVIIITARNRISDLIQGFKSGANDYITKPFLRNELLLRVQTQLKIQNAYKTLKENVELKEEILNRKITEQQLRVTQQKLSGMLNSVEEAVITINTNEEFCFINRAMEHLCGYKSHNLLGHHFNDIFKNNDVTILKDIKKEIESESGITKKFSNIQIHCFDGHLLTVDIIINKLKLSEDILSVLLIQPAIEINKTVLSNNRLPALADNFIAEINKNTSRMKILEECLDKINIDYFEKSPTLTSYLENIDNTLKQLNSFLAIDKNDQKRDLVAVKIINLSLEYWKKNTKKEKVDLAKMSGLWNVYTNLDGWERTQTFDKYLSIEKFPKNPNWKKVTDTIEFVLSICDDQSEEREQINELFTELKNLI